MREKPCSHPGAGEGGGEGRGRAGEDYKSHARFRCFRTERFCLTKLQSAYCEHSFQCSPPYYRTPTVITAFNIPRYTVERLL